MNLKPEKKLSSLLNARSSDYAGKQVLENYATSIVIFTDTRENADLPSDIVNELQLGF